MSNRRSFTAAFKRNVILYAEATNNCAAQRHFHISEKMVRGWRSQREQIFTCNSQRRAFRGPARGRHDDLEKELCWYIESERQKGIRLTCDDIQVRARQLAMRDGIDRSTFSASRGWAQRFLRRNGLSLRRKPRSSSQCRAPESEVERIEFERYVCYTHYLRHCCPDKYNMQRVNLSINYNTFPLHKHRRKTCHQSAFPMRFGGSAISGYLVDKKGRLVY